jgi:nucleotide-binding universal stress UspA family protein
MRPFRTILFAADFSENSREAFRVACSLAREDETRLFVVSIAESEWVAEDPVFFGQSTVQFYKEDRDGCRLEMIRQKLRDEYVPGHAINVEYHAREGDVAGEIIAMAREIGAELIAMGTHGRTGMNWLLSGSIATAVLRKAPCPVLALRSVAGVRKPEGIPVLLHPTDFSANSRAATKVARTLARDLGARLLILHVAPPAVLFDGTVAPQVDTNACSEALEELRTRLDGPDLKYPVETELRLGLDREEILRTSEEVMCDMIVMGTHGRTGLSRLLMGSVAEALLPRARCPLMVVRTPELASEAYPEKHVARQPVIVF